jgi:hypothetical protein
MRRRSADLYGRTFATMNYGMLYTAKDIPVLPVSFFWRLETATQTGDGGNGTGKRIGVPVALGETPGTCAEFVQCDFTQLLEYPYKSGAYANRIDRVTGQQRCYKKHLVRICDFDAHHRAALCLSYASRPGTGASHLRM